MTAGSRQQQEGVSEVLVRYATGIDSRDWDLFRSCFTDDCDADYGDIGHWHSGDEITAWMAQSHDPLGPTMHQIMNIAVNLDGGRVTSRSYVHAVVMTPDQKAAVHAYGRYDDEFSSTPDGWRIARRKFTPVTTEMHSPMS